jgi:outer membrane lipoprotein-sorting protein
MKTIRNIIAVMTIGATVFLSSCAKDDSSPSGMSDARDKYTGSWTCNETSQVHGNSTYTITISKDVTSANQVIAKNFYGLGTSTNTVIVIDGNNMTIQTQSVTGNTLSGTGTYNNNTLAFNFSADDGQTVDHVTVNAHH